MSFTSFISNVVDGVPLIGHVKGCVHYAIGDKDGCNRAMYQATRSSATAVGGIVGGVLGGPAGAAYGAMSSGTLTDMAAFYLKGEPQGIFKQIENVANDLRNDKNPTESVLVTTAYLGLDALGGIGMNMLSSSAGKKIASSMGEEIVTSVKLTMHEAAGLTTRKVSETVGKKTFEKIAAKGLIGTICTTTHILDRAVIQTKQEKANADQKKGKGQATKNENKKNEETKEEKSEKETNEKSSQSETNTSTGSGSQPPRQNQDNRENRACNDSEIVSDFLKRLKEILKSICRKENEEKFYNEFEKLTRGDRNYLKGLIKKLNYFGILEAVLKLVFQLFDLYFASDFTFPNFLSLVEFVKTYINNEIEKRSIISLGTDTSTLIRPFRQLTTFLITVIGNEANTLRNLYVMFRNIRDEIKSENENGNLDPNFNSEFSAVYHYFKHRIVPGDGILSVREYYNWIRCLLEKVKRLREFSDLSNRQIPSPRNQLVYELYVVDFGRRMKIVIKYVSFELNRTVLSSCYIITAIYDDDKEGDEFIDGVLRRNKD